MVALCQCSIQKRTIPKTHHINNYFTHTDIGFSSSLLFLALHLQISDITTINIRMSGPDSNSGSDPSEDVQEIALAQPTPPQPTFLHVLVSTGTHRPQEPSAILVTCPLPSVVYPPPYTAYPNQWMYPQYQTGQAPLQQSSAQLPQSLQDLQDQVAQLQQTVQALQNSRSSAHQLPPAPLTELSPASTSERPEAEAAQSLPAAVSPLQNTPRPFVELPTDSPQVGPSQSSPAPVSPLQDAPQPSVELPAAHPQAESPQSSPASVSPRQDTPQPPAPAAHDPIVMLARTPDLSEAHIRALLAQLAPEEDTPQSPPWTQGNLKAMLAQAQLLHLDDPWIEPRPPQPDDWSVLRTAFTFLTFLDVPIAGVLLSLLMYRWGLFGLVATAGLVFVYVWLRDDVVMVGPGRGRGRL
ncbi:hypothetical protein QBC44DRAFT_139549 [Cladorrhinum sp. PSN332]|nr:hypothetical protein QBC44DRAFT_139549 [Cladorrhinum sp. PSN332]